MYHNKTTFNKLTDYAALRGLTATKIQHWLTHRHLGLMLACVGIGLTLPSLWSGWVFDDYWHKAMFSGQWPYAADDASLFGMFSFLDGRPESAQILKESGLLPWWNFEGITMAFWRPLTELTHWLDYRLCPESPFLMHAHSLLWFGFAIWLVTKLYRRIAGPSWIAGLAALLFALDNTHMLPAGFIANRNTLIAGCFGLLAFLAYLRWSQDKWFPGLVLGPICYLLGLLSKESALAIGAYIFAYALLLDKNSLRRRLLAFLPYVLITLGWFFTYRHLGFGTQGLGIDLYIDPGRAPLLFLQELVTRLPILILAQLTGPPAEIWGVVSSFWPCGKFMTAVAAFLILSFIALCLFPIFKRDAVSRFWLVGAILGLIPLCAAFPSSRLLFFAGIGFMGIVARFLASCVSWEIQPSLLSDKFTPQPPLLGREGKKNHRVHSSSPSLFKRGGQGVSFRAVHGVALFFVCLHLVVAPITLLVYTSGLNVAHYLIRHYSSAMPYDDDISQKTVILVNPPFELMGGYISQVRSAHGESVPAKIWPMASGELPLAVSRVDERSLEIESEMGLLDTDFGKFLRGPSHPMQLGQRIELSGMSVEVLELLDNWQPSRVHVRFTRHLDDPSLLFLRWDGRAFRPYSVPAVGDSERFAPLGKWPAPLQRLLSRKQAEDERIQGARDVTPET